MKNCEGRTFQEAPRLQEFERGAANPLPSHREVGGSAALEEAFVICGLDEEAVEHCRDLIETIPGISFAPESGFDSIRSEARAFATFFDSNNPDQNLQEELIRLSLDYLAGTCDEKIGFVDTQSNLEELVGLSRKIGFQLVLVVRDPRDTASARRHGQVDECVALAQRWREVSRFALNCGNELLLVRYEDFRPELGLSTLGKVARFLDLESTPESVGVEVPVDTEKPLPLNLKSAIESEAADCLATLNY